MRVTDYSATCIDHFAIKYLNSAVATILKHENFSDHHPITVCFPVKNRFNSPSEFYRDVFFLQKMQHKLSQLVVSDDANASFSDLNYFLKSGQQIGSS